MAANDLTNLADVKAWLNIGTSDATYDAMLARLITACSMAMQAYMNRTLAVTTYSKTFNGNSKSQWMASNYPIQTITAVTVNGVAIPPAGPYGSGLSTPSGYYFDEDTVYLIGWSFMGGVQNCTIQYTAGLPASDPNYMALAQACIEVVGMRFKERGRIGERGKIVNQENIQFLIADFPPDVITLMERLRNVVPV